MEEDHFGYEDVESPEYEMEGDHFGSEGSNRLNTI